MCSDYKKSLAADPRRRFAASVVDTLRREGFQALWAGGCVRDELLGKVPKDYDVASTALPKDVIRIFGTRQTVPVGASFGVVLVLGPNRSAGQVEVATFRRDGDYLDGRRPSSVEFCRPEEDAQRRDFSINGLFFDPVTCEVIDYVGGREDLSAGVVRAIGDPSARFQEDKLRMLRAVRFAATFHFHLETQTADAIRQYHQDLNQVSTERISQELRRMLAHPSRRISVQLMEETRLLSDILPEIASLNGLLQNDLTLEILSHLEETRFEPAFSTLLRSLHSPEMPEFRQRTARIDEICRRLKLSNEENACLCWLLDSLGVMNGIQKKPLHVLKPLLAHSDSSLLIDLSAAMAQAEQRAPVDAEFCRRYLSENSTDQLNPVTLIDGRDVMEQGVPAGPAVRGILATIRNEQLDEKLTSRDQALLRLQQLIPRIV